MVVTGTLRQSVGFPGATKGLSLGSEKQLEFPLVIWAHNAMGHWAIPIYLLTNQSQKSDASQFEAMSNTPLTVLLPPGWDCVAVYDHWDKAERTS